MTKTLLQTRCNPLSVVIILVIGFILNACSAPAPVEIEPTGLAASSSATPSAIATLLPSATATAPALEVSDARPVIPQTPNPLGLATRCGVADFFDFPLDPSDASTVTGGQDFGVYRQRYEGYHTGEDWWYERRGSLGKPVFSIGNGRVRYAAPYGWGDDLGTLVIEHILPDGRRLYSFYGHIDPDSLILRAGRCVERGDQIGVIGDPRSSPHLHFEIRQIFADAPGPGYWSIDPAKSGWLPPSQTIEFSRYAADTRLVWWRAIDTAHLRMLGWLDEDILLNQEDSDLVAIDVRSGEELLRHPLEGLGVYAGWAPNQTQLYLADISGSISAYLLESTNRAQTPYSLQGAPLWTATMEGTGSIQLIPVEDGVVVIRRNHWSAYSASGKLRWREDPSAILTDWIEIDGVLIGVTAGEQGDIWTFSDEGAQAWHADLSGMLFSLDGVPYLYSSEGLFNLQLASSEAQELYSWSRAQLGQAQILDLGPAGMLLLHKDVYDQRLLQLDREVELVWERSLPVITADDVHLIRCGGSVLLMTEQDRPSSVQVELLRLDEKGSAERIFQTIVRTPYQTGSGGTCVDNSSIVLTFGGQRLMRFELSAE